MKQFQAVFAGERREYLKPILAQAARHGAQRQFLVIDQ